MFKITSENLETGEPTNDISVSSNYADTFGIPLIYDVRCKSKSNDQSIACQFLLSSENGAIILIQQGIYWLASYVCTLINLRNIFFKEKFVGIVMKH